MIRKRLASANLLLPEVRLLLKCDGARAETRFRLSAKRTSLFKSAGVSVRSTAGSRGVRISGSNAGYTMFQGRVKSTGYPLHSPVSPFTSPPVRHRVPSHFSWTPRQAYCGVWRIEIGMPSAISEFGKRFLLGGAEDFSRHLYAQTGSRICPDSYPVVCPLRVKDVNYEATHFHA